MILIRILRGEEPLWVSILLCGLLKAIYVGVMLAIPDTLTPFDMQLSRVCRILILTYCVFGIVQCAPNTASPVAKWLAIVWAVLLAVWGIFSIFKLLGLLYGMVAIGVIVSAWFKMWD
jgi:hypothetical protein